MLPELVMLHVGVLLNLIKWQLLGPWDCRADLLNSQATGLKVPCIWAGANKCAGRCAGGATLALPDPIDSHAAFQC